MDVYAVTAPTERKPPAVKQPSEFGGSIFSSSGEFESPDPTRDPSSFEGMPKAFSLSALTSMSGEGTIEEFCKFLERSLDRPLLNETNLQGLFEFRLDQSPASTGDFLVRLREELGLAIEPAERNVQLLVFNPR